MSENICCNAKKNPNKSNSHIGRLPSNLKKKNFFMNSNSSSTLHILSIR